MITGEYEQLRDIADNSVCAEHKAHLTVAWHKDKNCYYLKCGTCDECKAVVRVESPTELFKRGEPLPGPVEDNVRKGLAKRAAKVPKVPGAVTTFGISAVDLDTGELVPYERLAALVLYARSYGLDPMRGHVALMHGEPYITIDGYLYHAHQQKVHFSLTGRPLRIDEMEAQGYGVGDLGWKSTVTKLDTGEVFEGYGFVKDSELTEMSKKHPDRLRYPVVAEKPGDMVIKRGDWQALRRAFPIGETREEVDRV